MRRLIAVALLLVCGGVASAHRLDEYLQATLLTVEPGRMTASMRLIPGVAVASSVVAAIDSNGDGVLSEAEQQAYARQVLGDLSLSLDGERLTPRLVSVKFPAVSEIKDGLGEIYINYAAELPAVGPERRLVIENHHRNAGSAYLVNAVAPRDPAIQISEQKRNESQSVYELDYTQAGAVAAPRSWWTTLAAWGRESTGSVGFASIFRLGMQHIAEGTDHLLFLLALLLPAPLLASGTRWGGPASVRASLLRILKIVTAFTLGHSITLALAAFGVVHVPSGPIEALIAVSILISAVHALRPLFPGREAYIAAFFGLIHGLAFATTLGELGLARWQMVGGVLAFNLGIETMQMVVVAATLPSLLLLSRTQAYPFLRVAGALFAGVASIGWIAERLFGLQTSVDGVVNSVAHHAVWIAGVLFVLSLSCYWTSRDKRQALTNGRTFEFDPPRQGVPVTK